MAQESTTEKNDREAKAAAEQAKAAEEQRRAAEVAAQTARWLANANK